MIKGTYQFELGKPFTVEDKDLQWNESLPLYKIAGKVTREGAAQSTDVPGIHFQSEEQKTITSGSVAQRLGIGLIWKREPIT